MPKVESHMDKLESIIKTLKRGESIQILSLVDDSRGKVIKVHYTNKKKHNNFVCFLFEVIENPQPVKALNFETPHIKPKHGGFESFGKKPKDDTFNPEIMTHIGIIKTMMVFSPEKVLESIVTIEHVHYRKLEINGYALFFDIGTNNLRKLETPAGERIYTPIKPIDLTKVIFKA